MNTLHEIWNMPELRECFDGNPIHLIPLLFTLLVLYVVVGGTVSMVWNQIKFLYHAVTHRTEPDLRDLHPYTRSLIAGTAPELVRLQRVFSPSARIPTLKIICCKLECDSTPLAKSLRRQFRQRLAQEQRLAHTVRDRLDGHGNKGTVYVVGGIGEA